MCAKRVGLGKFGYFKWWVMSDGWWVMKTKWGVMSDGKKKKSKQGHVGDLEVRGIFESSFQEFLPPNFLSILMRKLFGRSEEKTPGSHNLFFFLPTQPNTV